MVCIMLFGLFAGCNGQATTSTPSSIAASAPSKAPDISEAPTESGEKILIGCPLSNFADKSIAYVRAGLELYAKDNPNIELVIQDSKWDANTQIALVENMIAIGCKAIIMNPVESTACQPIVNACEEAGVYLICFSKRMSDELQERLEGKGNIAMIYGKMGTENMVKRSEGFKNIMSKYPDMKLVAENTANWKREEALAVVENWIQTGVEFDAIVCNNDEMAIGAALALQSQGLNPADYVIAGLDGTPDSLQFMKDGLLTVTAYDDWKNIYEGSINMAIDLVNGITLDKENITISETVMADQADEYLARWDTLVRAVTELDS